ncbi:MAG TPA: hypothetical protein VGH45_03410 [Solirubrobacteraceae bacterium]
MTNSAGRGLSTTRSATGAARPQRSVQDQPDYWDAGTERAMNRYGL